MQPHVCQHQWTSYATVEAEGVRGLLASETPLSLRYSIKDGEGRILQGRRSHLFMAAVVIRITYATLNTAHWFAFYNVIHVEN